MTVAELINVLKGLPDDAEVVIVHNDWPIKKAEVNIKEKRVTLK